MSFEGRHFNQGFDIGDVFSSALQSALRKLGITATWWKRRRETKDSETGHSPEAWSTTTVFIVSFPVQSSVKETPAGDAVNERHEVYCDISMTVGDRLVWGGDTYQVDMGPENALQGRGNYYKYIMVKRT